jgi:HPt (histidine-containing phosphotransfer) domain-containing protein
MSDIEARLTALRHRFLVRLGADRRLLQSEAGDLRAREPMLRIVHRIAGLAGSVGLPALGQAAQACEAAVIAQPAAALADTPEFRSLLEATDEALERCGC